jgi:GTPase SAR1 family protein
MMAKNEIKMLLLGAGESGKVCAVASQTGSYYNPLIYITITVDCFEADEAYSSWRL